MIHVINNVFLHTFSSHPRRAESFPSIHFPPSWKPERSNKFISKHNFTENTLIMEKLLILIATEMVLLCGCKHLLHPASRKKYSGTISYSDGRTLVNHRDPWILWYSNLIIIDLMMTDLGHSWKYVFSKGKVILFCPQILPTSAPTFSRFRPNQMHYVTPTSLCSFESGWSDEDNDNY